MSIVHYEDLCTTSDINIFGNIAIFAGYPGIGKFDACESLEMDECFSTIQLSYTAFMQNKGVTPDNWVSLYVKKIKTRISEASLRQDLAGHDDHKTYIITISSHPEIRKALSAEGIPFFYVRPDPKCTRDFLEEKILELKYEEEPRSERRTERLAFANTALKAIQTAGANAIDDELDLPHQVVIYTGINNGEFVDLQDVIYAITKIPVDYRCEHATPAWYSYEYHRSLARKMVKMLFNGIDYPFAIKALMKHAVLGISSQNLPYIILEDKRESAYRFQCKQVKKHSIPKAIADKLANVGSDFVVIHRDDAMNIVDMLNDAICQLESGNRSDNDVEVFGDRAISYERLIDELDHTTLPLKPKKNDAVTDKDQKKGSRYGLVIVSPDIDDDADSDE